MKMSSVYFDRRMFLIVWLAIVAFLLLSGCGPEPQVDPISHGSGIYPIRYDYNVDGEIWFRNSGIQLRFDRDLYCRVFLRKSEKLYSVNDIPPYEEKAKPPDFLVVKGKEIKNFLADYQDIGASEMKTQLGNSKRFNLSGYAKTDEGISLRKNLQIDFFQEFPDLALIRTSYQNLDPQRSLFINQFYSGFYRMDAARGQTGSPGYLFQSMLGSASQVQLLGENFSKKEKVIGSAAGRPEPFLDLWCNLMGMAVGVFPGEMPEITLLLQVAPDKRAEMGIALEFGKELKPGESFTLPRAFLMVHTGDFRIAFQQYMRLKNNIDGNSR
jgi:hypothetical protein